MAKYIDGIFNYCDRWCERCPFTQRCRSFSMGLALERKMARKDKENEAFWDAMDNVCGDALDLLSQQADELKEEESDEEKEEEAAFGKEMDEQDRAVRSHIVARAADKYLWAAHGWLERGRERMPAEIQDAVEVIGWYHMFISVKLCRALCGLIDQEEEDWEDLVDDDGTAYPKDSDGSAKIAIIGIERSISAWSIVRDQVDKERETAVKMMALLLRVRSLAEQYFPDARKFHRPGFDDVGSRD